MATSEPVPFRFEPRPSRWGRLLLAQLLLVTGGGLAGYGVGCTVIDANGHAPASYVAGNDIGAATIGGLVVAVVALVMWSTVDRHPLAAGQLHAWGAALPAGALGLLVAASQLGVAGWYVGVAFALAAAGLVALLLGFAAVARRRRRYRHELDLIARGTAVPATVVDPGVDPHDFEEASNVITTMTVRFVIGGSTHRLRRLVTIPRHGLVVEGQRTTVWYDPADPTDDKAMVLAIQHALRWNVPVPVPRAASTAPAVTS